MKSLKSKLPLFLVILLELVMGVMLIFEPDQLTTYVLLASGGILALIGIIYIIRFFIDKKNDDQNILTIVLGVIAFLAGAAFIVFALIDYTTLVIFGLILAILGIFKIVLHSDMKSAEQPTTFYLVLSGILSVILGAAVIFFAFKDEDFTPVLTIIAFLFEAALDIFAVVMMAKKKKSMAEK